MIADFLNHRIRKISTSGIVSTIEGSGIAGLLNGTGIIARFNYPRGIAVDSLDNIYIADSWNHRIRKIDGISYAVSTYAGGGNNIGVSSVGDLVDGSDTVARFYTPSGLTIDNIGNLYVADPFNHRIRKIGASQYVTTLAGSGPTGPGNGGFADGNANIARFNTPTDLFWSIKGDLYIGDTYNNRIRLIDNSLMASSFAGNGNAGFVNDPDSIAEFNFPRGITSSPEGDSIFVVDHNNHSIRLIRKDNTSSINNNSYNLGKYEITLFPNPTSDKLYIKLIDQKKTGFIKIYNLLGSLVYNNTIQSNHLEIDTEHLHTGLYILVFESGNYKTNCKLLVE